MSCALLPISISIWLLFVVLGWVLCSVCASGKYCLSSTDIHHSLRHYIVEMEGRGTLAYCVHWKPYYKCDKNVEKADRKSMFVMLKSFFLSVYCLPSFVNLFQSRIFLVKKKKKNLYLKIMIILVVSIWNCPIGITSWTCHILVLLGIS